MIIYSNYVSQNLEQRKLNRKIPVELRISMVIPIKYRRFLSQCGNIISAKNGIDKGTKCPFEIKNKLLLTVWEEKDSIGLFLSSESLFFR